MIRVQAYIVGKTDDIYKVEAVAEGVTDPFTFDIKARTAGEAAMEAIRRVEAFDDATRKTSRTH
jgi:hypothetical protein